MDYIVTGGAGYIGTYLSERLHYEKHKVTIIDDLSTGNPPSKKSNFIKFDLRSSDSLELPEGAHMLHLAADAEVRGSMFDIRKSFDRNTTLTLNALELARKANAKTFLFTSSSTIYGEAQTPTPESHRLSPISNYGLFKLLGEQLVENYAANYGIKSVALRFANVTGGNVTHGIIKNWATCIKQGKPIEIWGDGKQRKSYVYYTDVLDAILSCVKNAKAGFSAYNVGSNDTVSVEQIREELANELGGDVKTVYKPAQEGDVKHMLLDTTKLSKETGWTSKFDSRNAVRQSFKDVL